MCSRIGKREREREYIWNEIGEISCVEIPHRITLGNQLDGIRLVDPELINQFQRRYPDGNCMAPNLGHK